MVKRASEPRRPRFKVPTSIRTGAGNDVLLTSLSGYQVDEQADNGIEQSPNVQDFILVLIKNYLCGGGGAHSSLESAIQDSRNETLQESFSLAQDLDM